jgi:hypothetical protein
MEIELINVGRNNVNKTLTVKNEKQMWKELHQHILSRYIELEETETPNTYDICVGMRTVGQIKITE